MREPMGGLLRLSLGHVSFTEVFAMFFIGYSVALIVLGPPSATPVPTRGPAGAPPPPPVGRFGGGFGLFARGSAPVAAGTALALITFLIRADIVGRITSPQSQRSLNTIVGLPATVVDAIPAGGIGHITFHDANGMLVGVVASADMDIPEGTAVRIVGTRGLNPLVAPERSTDVAPA